MKQLIAVMALSAILTGGLAAQIVTNNNYAAGSDFGYEIVLSDTTTLLPIGNVVRYGNFSGSLTDAELQGFLTGGLTPAELATILQQQADGTILADGSVPFEADQSMGGNQLTNVGDPVDAQDAATKAYVDENAIVGPVSSTDRAIAA